MWNRRALFAAAAAVATPMPALAQAAGKAGRRAEVAAVRRFAETTHPRGREAAADADWHARWDRLATQADTASDGVYIVAMRRALAWFRDGHTSVAVHAIGGETPEPLKGGEWALKAPLKLSVFDDGLWVTVAGEEAGDIIGRRVTAINGMNVNDLMRRHADAWTGTDAWAHAWAGEVFIGLGDLTGLGVAQGRGPVRYAVEGPDGSLIERNLAPVATVPQMRLVPHPPGDIERWTAEAGGRNFMRLLEEGRTLFVSLDEMNDVDGHGIIDLIRAILVAMAEPALQRVVIDLRRNGGGNNGFGEPLRKALERSRFNHPGGLYVLAGPRTFSAAQNLATRLERETYAIFAGGPTGGIPNHYGDARRTIGEATGVPVYVSTLPWFDSAPQDERSWILPDLVTDWTYADWAAGRDPALTAVLADTTTGVGNDVSLLRSFPYRRPSQAVAWTPFWREG